MKKIVMFFICMVLAVSSVPASASENRDGTIDLNKIPRNWVGEYDGHTTVNHERVVVRRNYAIHINEIDPDGKITGTAEFSPSDKAPAQYGLSGAYYFGGSIKAETGEIRMQGNEWDIKPKDNFSFVILEGIIDDEYRTIQGRSENGIWYMEASDKVDMSMYVDDDNVLHSDNGHGYKLVEMEGGDWDRAQNYCKKSGGHIATLTSQEENDAVYGYLRMIGAKNAYFGLTDAGEEGTWKWVTGEEFSYSNWASGEPNGENEKEDYAMFYEKYEDGKWNDGDFIGDSVPVLCEWDDYEGSHPGQEDSDETAGGQQDRNPDGESEEEAEEAEEAEEESGDENDDGSTLWNLIEQIRH